MPFRRFRKGHIVPKAASSLAPIRENTPFDEPLLNSFRRGLRAANKSPATQRHYLGSTQMFVDFCRANNLPSLENITREHIELWLIPLYERYAVASVRTFFVGLQQFYKWMREEGEIGYDPFARIKRPVLEETSKDVVPAKQMADALTYLEKMKPPAYRECMVLALIYDTGIRETELADTRMADVDLDGGELLIPKTKNKTQRTIPLTPQVVRYIDRYLRNANRLEPEYLVNGKHSGKMTGKGIYQAVRDVFCKLGYPALIGPHDLRHTAATALALNGMEEAKMMRILGWKDPKMARRYTSQVQQQIAIEDHRTRSPMQNLPVKRRG